MAQIGGFSELSFNGGIPSNQRLRAPNEMATDFFERQADARKSTTWLIAMFCLAVFVIVFTVFVFGTALVVKGHPEPVAMLQQSPRQLALPLIISAITLLLIIGGTLFKVFELRRGGGTLVARNIGGKRIYPNSSENVERRLLNVVEEMSIASGTPVPPVFLLDEDGINAFAAGYSTSDAVLGVTRGCATKLTRDELQGVIAHEFSHILNGDMRMSIRLMGVLHGILLLGLAGQWIFRLSHYGRSGRGKAPGSVTAVTMLTALAFIVVGFAGTFLGNLIKAAVSRQREHLADASAVQFTRNPQALAGALKKIGGSAFGSRLNSARAAEASHMFFAKGVFEGFSGLWATHPALEDRILAIEPDWDGAYPAFSEIETTDSSGPANANVARFVGEVGGAASPSSPRNPAVETSLSANEEVPIDVVDHAVDHVGEPTEAHRHYAADLLAKIPPVVLDTAREPYGARAVLFALLLDRNDASIRQNQLNVLESNAKPDIVKLTRRLSPIMDSLDTRARLPLVDLALPALRAMCLAQYQEFSKCFGALIKADQQLDLFEWMLAQVLIRHLRPQFEQVRSPEIDYYGLQQLGQPCAILLAAVSHAGNSDEQADEAFQTAAEHLPEVPLANCGRDHCGLAQINNAVKTLSTVSAKHRTRVVDACAAAICTDNHVRWQEAELLRGISDLLDCPMPPLLVRKTVDPSAVQEQSSLLAV